MKKFLHLLMAIFVSFLCGCASIELELKPDITLDLLEKRMAKAMDPNGKFKNANNFVQQEMLKIPGLFFETLYQIDIKSMKGGYYKATTLEHNQPIKSVIFNRGIAWSVDYRKNKVKEIIGDELVRLKSLNMLSTPGVSYRQIFKDVTLKMVEVDNKIYYKIHCQSPNDEEIYLDIYVDTNKYLTRIVNASVNMGSKINKKIVKYSTKVIAYELIDDVMIPQKYSTTANSIESFSTVFIFKLNTKMEKSEFLPPIFIEK